MLARGIDEYEPKLPALHRIRIFAGYTGTLSATVANPNLVEVIFQDMQAGAMIESTPLGNPNSPTYNTGSTTVTITDSGTNSSVVIPVTVIGPAIDMPGTAGSFLASDTTPHTATPDCAGNSRVLTFQGDGGIGSITAVSTNTSGFTVTAGPATGDPSKVSFNVNFVGTTSGFVHATYNGNDVYYPYQTAGTGTAASFADGCS